MNDPREALNSALNDRERVRWVPTPAPGARSSFAPLIGGD